ncbi:MAG TPA: methyltransferase domain-containing protein, partial [Zoogloea sp.]|nr:methyltransferase domain-containing protein [Zoogloea sp.]
MPDNTPDLNTLLQRLRSVANEHGDARIPQNVPALAWAAAPEAPVNALQATLMAGAGNHGGLTPYLVVDDESFVQLIYQGLLGRAPDAQGRAFHLDRLRLRTPRTEVMAEMVLSAEARRNHLGGWLQRVQCRLLLLALHPPLLRTERVGRAVLRRVEARLARRARRTAFGLSWQLARSQDAQALQVFAQLAAAQGAHADLQKTLGGFQDVQTNFRQELAVLSGEHAGLKDANAGLRDDQAGLREQQAGFNDTIASLRDVQAGLSGQQAGLNDAIASLRDDQARLRDEQAGLNDALAGLEDAQAGLNDEQAGLRQAQADLKAAQAVLKRHLTDQFVSLQLATVQRLALAPEDRAAAADFFAAFESHFRGPAAALRDQLEQDYLGRLIERREMLGEAPCLDLGCGRGVWLELLRDHGFAAQGVDLNARAIAEAQDQGLNAQFNDALQWLRGLPDDFALAITAFHLMEHLPFSVRLALVAECARVLKPGGLLILETPNPENIWVGTHTFYHDPTHSQPLTPDSLEFLVNYHG